MGFALADAAQRAGAKVTLIAGPIQQSAPANVERIDVISAADMFTAVMQHTAFADIFISVAAVADYRVRKPRTEKIKKTGQTLSLQLAPNPDILSAVAALDNKPFCVGFAAETNLIETYALEKMQRKKLDMIAANHVGTPDSGFTCDNNQLVVLTRDGKREVLADAPKTRIATQLIDLIVKHFPQ